VTDNGVVHNSLEFRIIVVTVSLWTKFTVHYIVDKFHNLYICLVICSFFNDVISTFGTAASRFWMYLGRVRKTIKFISPTRRHSGRDSNRATSEYLLCAYYTGKRKLNTCFKCVLINCTQFYVISCSVGMNIETKQD